MDLFVFDLNLNRIGLIDDFIDLTINPSYDSLGSLKMIVDGSKENLNLLKADRLLVNSEDLSKGFIIKTREFIDENSSELEIFAPSINILLNDRVVLGQQEFTGTIENVMKSFVQANAISPVNINRVIPNLVSSVNRGIDITTTEGTKNTPLCDYMYELSKKHDVTFNLLLDHVNKKFVFDVEQGTDRSTEQSLNAHVIFSKAFDNVLKQHYTESVGDLKNTAIVLGEENETTGQVVITINDSISGLERKELIVDANSLKSTYTDDNSVEVVLTPAEYEVLLIAEGNNRLSEFQSITSFESDVDAESNFIFGVDYFMGDKVSIRNDDLNVILHTRIMSVIENVNRNGKSLRLNFGSNTPSFIDKVKRAVK